MTSLLPSRAAVLADMTASLGWALLHYLLVVDVVVVQVAHQVHTLLRAEGDEAEAPVSLSNLVHQHDAVLHTSVLTEIFLHLLGRGVLADSSNKDLPSLRLFALGFR